MEYDAEHRQEDNTQPESAYVALRNMSVRLKTPTMNNYPEIGDIKHVMEEAVMEWSTDEEKEMVKIFCEQNQKHLTDLWRLNDIPIFQNNPKAEYHLDKACYHLIMVQNCFWDQHFNYGRIMREKRESELQEKNKSKSLLDTLKKILMLWRWEE